MSFQLTTVLRLRPEGLLALGLCLWTFCTCSREETNSDRSYTGAVNCDDLPDHEMQVLEVARDSQKAKFLPGRKLLLHAHIHRIYILKLSSGKSRNSIVRHFIKQMFCLHVKTDENHMWTEFQHVCLVNFFLFTHCPDLWWLLRAAAHGWLCFSILELQSVVVGIRGQGNCMEWKSYMPFWLCQVLDSLLPSPRLYCLVRKNTENHSWSSIIVS